MAWLKGIGYLVAAVALLTMLITGFAVIVIAGIVIGLVANATGATLLTAASLRRYFERPK